MGQWLAARSGADPVSGITDLSHQPRHGGRTTLDQVVGTPEPFDSSTQAKMTVTTVSAGVRNVLTTPSDALESTVSQ